MKTESTTLATKWYQTAIAFLIAVVAMMTVTACGPSAPLPNQEQTKGNEANARFITRIKNCDIYEATYKSTPEAWASTMKLAVCDGPSASMAYQVGKQHYNDIAIPKPPEPTPEQIAEQKRLAAIAKLSPEERTLLGIK